MEVLRFFFDDFWHFVGLMFVLSTVASIIGAICQ